jgi:hypothetical protein
MARRIMAPKVAIRIDGKLRPVTSGPPKRLTMKPPIKAPTTPMAIVRTMPPGSGPGVAILASIPAISPTIMRAKIPKVLPPPLAIALFYATVPDSIAYI